MKKCDIYTQTVFCVLPSLASLRSWVEAGVGVKDVVDGEFR